MSKPVNLANFTSNEIDDWIKNFDTFFFDCDGVIWLHEELFTHANDVINQLVALNKRIFLVTNNSQTTREEMVEKCKRMNFNLGLESMMTPSYASALYLKQLGFDKKVYAVGPEALGKALDEFGIKHVGIGPDNLDEGSVVKFVMQNYEPDEEVGAVVVGFDANFSYKKLFKATNYLCKPEVKFIATNKEDSYQFPWFLLPEAGPLVKAIESASGRSPLVIGKPSTYLYDVIKENITSPIDMSKAIMIGDRIDTDVPFGKNCGMKTLLVESGMSKMKDVEEILAKISGKSDENLSKMVPDFVLPHLGDIFKKLTNKM